MICQYQIFKENAVLSLGFIKIFDSLCSTIMKFIKKNIGD
jgi:hypothetical protein